MENSPAPTVLFSNGAYSYMVLYTLMVGLVLLSGVIGNVLIIAVTICTKALKSLTGTLVLTLAVADLFVLITILPFVVLVNLQGGWKQGPVLCYAVGFAETFVTTASVLSMALISYDRYVAIVRPEYYEDLKLRFAKRAGFSAIALWIGGFANAVIPIIDGSGYSFNEVTGTCTVNWKVMSFTATCIVGAIRFLLPFIVFTFSYVKIFHMAKRAKRKINPCVAPKTKQSRLSTQSNSSEDTYLTNTNSPDRQDNQSTALSSSTTNNCSSSYSASIEDNTQSVNSKVEPHLVRSDKVIQIHHELLLHVNDVGKTFHASMARTDTQHNIPYSMVSALSNGSGQRPGTGHGVHPWQRAVANRLTKRKVFRSMLLLYGTFLFTWLPYSLWTLWIHFVKDPSTTWARSVFAVAVCNSLFNVYLYGFVKSTYRKALRGCLKKKLSLKRVRKTITTHVQRVDVATVSRSIQMHSKRQSEVKYQSRVETEHEYVSHQTKNHEYSSRVKVFAHALPVAQ